MVIEVVHIPGVSVLETKDDPPVSRDGHGVEALQSATQRVQPQPGCIHVGGGCSRVEQRKDLALPFDMRLMHASAFIIMKQRRQTLVPEVAYHLAIVSCYVTGVKHKER